VGHETAVEAHRHVRHLSPIVAYNPGGARRDPRNRLLSRGARYRLEAEMVRDQALGAEWPAE